MWQTKFLGEFWRFVYRSPLKNWRLGWESHDKTFLFSSVELNIFSPVTCRKKDSWKPLSISCNGRTVTLHRDLFIWVNFVGEHFSPLLLNLTFRSSFIATWNIFHQGFRKLKNVNVFEGVTFLPLLLSQWMQLKDIKIYTSCFSLPWTFLHFSEDALFLNFCFYPRNNRVPPPPT